MSKIILSTLVVLLGLSVGNVVSAETNTGNNFRNNIKTAAQKLLPSTRAVQEKRVEMRGAPATTTPKLVEERVEKRFEAMANRYLKAIEKEEGFMARIVSRIEKIKSNTATSTPTINITEAERLVAVAKKSLAEARTNYETLKTRVGSADTATTTKAVLTNMKSSVKLIEKNLREAHQALQKTVGVLKGVSGLRNATSTREN